ncbi:MAG: carbohydrate ABC transporter permease [Anaerolineales bacterium]|nr:carbohydrate ABC transporter permease [Anaerolineales bacterium]
MAVSQPMPSTRQNTIARWRRRFGLALLTVVLLAFTMLVIIPFVWMTILSFRTTVEILTDPYGLPQTWRWENYAKLLFDPEIAFYRFFLNSLFVTFFALILTIILSTLGGYGFGRSRYDFQFRGWLFTLLLFALMLPPQIMYIPQFTMMSRYGLLNSRWSLVLLYTAMALPVSTYLMSTYFSQLPSELEDAARIDGCNDFGMFWRVMLPLTRPAILTVVLINGIQFWNELLLAVTMVTEPAKRTLPAAMMMFVGEHSADYSIAAASLVTAMLPVLIVYLIISDRFIEGLTAGALKG